MILTANFTLGELTTTNTGLVNKPSLADIYCLKLLAANVLQKARNLYGGPIRVTSGYRSAQVNKAVGGSATSQHCKGQAADLVCANNARLFAIIRDQLEYDQLIWESGNDKQPDWIHVSFVPEKNRRQVLRMKNGKYTTI